MSADKKSKRQDPQPAQIAPTGFGHMPLFCAAQWIATSGHSIHWDEVPASSWDSAYRNLCAAIADGSVEAVGEHKGQKDRVPPALFVDCQVSHVGNLEYGDRDEYYLSSVPYIDEERWRDDMNDQLIGRSGRPNWDRLQVRREDIRKLWPAGADASHPGPRKTGRPTPEDVYLIEYAARIKRGEVEKSARDEARCLLDWAKNAVPATSQVKLKTIEGYLRKYREKQSGNTESPGRL